ncbi:hypothetical protein P8452_52956 [Trifolium repens]|nr:hypothetical protein P8452_52956 [Trifolium repens]
MGGGDDAFRPTSPGHSPGVGHQTLPGPNKGGDGVVFPTESGPSAPGVGHKVPLMPLNVYNMGGGDDAFRPTNPGHSPGVRHQTPPSLQVFI